jgi:hypothetical protein
MPKRPYRRGYQHGAAAVLRALANGLDATTARRFANWVGVDLRAWRTLGRAEAQLEEPPPPHGRYPAAWIGSFEEQERA